MDSKITKLVIIFLIINILFVIIGNVLWTKKNYSLRGQDTIIHLLGSLEFYYLFENTIKDKTKSIICRFLEVIRLIKDEIPHIGKQYPNGMYFITSILYHFFGKSLFVAKLSNLLFLLILVVMLLIMGSYIHSYLVGIIAVYLTLYFPLIFESMRQYSLDFPLTAMVLLSTWLLIKTEKFSSLKYSILFGLCVGIGTYVKAQIMIFISVPLIIKAIEAVSDKKYLSKRLLNVLISFFCIMIFALQYRSKYEEFIEPTMRIVISNSFNLSPNLPYIKRILVILNNLGLYGMGFPIFAISIVLSYFFFKNYKKDKNIFFLLLSVPIIIIPILIIPIAMRHLMPILPFISLMTAWGVVNIKRKFTLIFLTSVIILYMPVRYYMLTFAAENVQRKFVGDLHNGFDMPNRGISKIRFPLFGGTGYSDFSITRDINKYNELCRYFNSFTQDNKIKVLVVPLFIPDEFEAHYIRYWLRMNNDNLDIVGFCGMYQTAYQHMNEFDFILVKADSDKFNWPLKSEITNVLEKTCNILLFNYFNFSSIKNDLIDDLYKQIEYYEYVKTIDTKAGYNWIIFKKNSF